jgi:hypothetical protein
MTQFEHEDIAIAYTELIKKTRMFKQKQGFNLDSKLAIDQLVTDLQRLQSQHRINYCELTETEAA